MPIIKTFVSHHGDDFPDRVAPLLRRVTPLGIRPWLDKEDLQGDVGLPLGESLHRAITSGVCQSVSLFLSRASTKRKWIEQEVSWALNHERQRILPVLLDPLESLDLPPDFRELLIHRKVLYLDPQRDDFPQRYATAVLAAAGINADTEALTLCLGHRSGNWHTILPPGLRDDPALDLRLGILGDPDFCPTEAEWQEIAAGLRFLKTRLPGLRRLQICGQAPLGVGMLVGAVWDRGSGVCGPLELRSHNFRTGQLWTTSAADEGMTTGWTPQSARHVRMSEPALLHHEVAQVVFLLAGKDEILRQVRAWNDQRPTPPLLLTAMVPLEYGDAAHAVAVATECVAALRYLRARNPRLRTIEVIPTFPLALAPLFAHHLRNLGPLRLYDEVKKSDPKEYRLVATL